MTDEPVKAADRVYQQLREGILEGRYVGGVRLGEIDLAESLGVSRTPVREALRRLGSEGLVEITPHRGARVVQWTAQDLIEIYQLRALLEGFGAATAAERMDSDDIDRLEKLCEDMEEVTRPGLRGDLERLTVLNSEFHSTILRSSGSNRLAILVQSLVQVPLMLRTYHRYDQEALRRSLSHHRELVAALRASNSRWAESVMRSHVLAASDVLVRDARAVSR